MTLAQTILAVLLATTFIAWILFVIFGQITVRKLRKNPETKHELGIEFVSGWDIFNVAQALSLPAALEKRLKNKKKSSIFNKTIHKRGKKNTRK